jgi:hypothetical protein
MSFAESMVRHISLKLVAAHLARQQAELAMLQRALVSCGLMGHETNGTRPTDRTRATDRTKEW